MLTSLAAQLPQSAELIAFCIVERRDAPPAWIRCGRAQLNADGSVRVHLDALPLSGELHLRPPSVRRLPPAAAGQGNGAMKPLHS